jgi:hypothetical protein
MKYNEPKKYDVQIDKQINEKHYEAYIAPIPGPKKPSFQSIMLAFIQEQRAFNKMIMERMNQNGLKP